MDASLWVALLDLLWLILLAFAWLKDKRNHIRIHEVQREWLESLSERLRDLEGRIEDARKMHEQDAVIVNSWADEIKALKKDLEGLQMVNDAEHHALLEHQKCIVKDMKEAQGGKR
jgi:hypothetical protein